MKRRKIAKGQPYCTLFWQMIFKASTDSRECAWPAKRLKAEAALPKGNCPVTFCHFENSFQASSIFESLFPLSQRVILSIGLHGAHLKIKNDPIVNAVTVLDWRDKRVAPRAYLCHFAPDLSTLDIGNVPCIGQVQPIRLVQLGANQEVEVTDALVFPHQCGCQAKLAVGFGNPNDLRGIGTTLCRCIACHASSRDWLRRSFDDCTVNTAVMTTFCEYCFIRKPLLFLYRSWCYKILHCLQA